MPRNRTIYNALALYVSEQSAADKIGLHNAKQLSRIQSFDEDFTRNFTDVNQFGNLAAIDRIEVENPDVTASFSYFLTDGQNEKKLGLNVYPSGTPQSGLRSCISGLLSKDTDEKNYYLSIVEEGNDAAGYVGTKSGIIGVGNGFLTSYSVNAAVGDIPTADVEIEGLNIRVYNNVNSNEIVPAIQPADGTDLTDTFFRLPPATSITGDAIPNALQPGDILFTLPANSTIGFDGADLKVQDFTLSFDLARTPLQKLGSRFAFSREIDFPVTATLEVNAEVGDLQSGSLSAVICSPSELEFVIQMKAPGCGTNKPTALAYVFKGAKLVSQSFSSAIGDNATMTASYEVQLGGPQDTAKGIFISGSFNPILFEQGSNQILNSKFDTDNQFPLEIGRYDGNYNAYGPTPGDSNILTNYIHNSPLLYEYSGSTLYSYQTFANRTFHQLQSPNELLLLGHQLQPRLLKMFGAGTKFGVPDSFYGENANGLRTITNTSNFTPSGSESWVKYGTAQYTQVPSWATKVKFGVSYLVKSGDLLRANNFGGLALSFKGGDTRSYINVFGIRNNSSDGFPDRFNVTPTPTMTYPEFSNLTIPGWPEEDGTGPSFSGMYVRSGTRNGRPRWINPSGRSYPAATIVIQYGTHPFFDNPLFNDYNFGFTPSVENLWFIGAYDDSDNYYTINGDLTPNQFSTVGNYPLPSGWEPSGPGGAYGPAPTFEPIFDNTDSGIAQLEAFYNTGSYSYFNANSGQNAMCQWVGPLNSKVKVKKLRNFDKPDQNNQLNKFNTVDFTVDIPTFSTSSNAPDDFSGRPESVCLEMFFAEWLNYLNNDDVDSGAIYFYKPFLYFE